MLLIGSNVSENKATFLALQAIYGMGKTRALAVCNLVGICPEAKLSELNATQLDLVIKSCRRLTPGNQKRDKVEAIKELVRISCYRGTRHINALPCRGQRTRTNAYTSKNLLSKYRSLLK
jgi:small subunit ribosomal protein S13